MRKNYSEDEDVNSMDTDGTMSSKRYCKILHLILNTYV
jgi:hypothetical protein